MISGTLFSGDLSDFLDRNPPYEVVCRLISHIITSSLMTWTQHLDINDADFASLTCHSAAN